MPHFVAEQILPPCLTLPHVVLHTNHLTADELCTLYSLLFPIHNRFSTSICVKRYSWKKKIDKLRVRHPQSLSFFLPSFVFFWRPQRAPPPPPPPILFVLLSMHSPFTISTRPSLSFCRETFFMLGNIKRARLTR